MGATILSMHFWKQAVMLCGSCDGTTIYCAPRSADSQEDDPELLLHVPFNGAVKLTGITVIGGGDSTSPAKLKVRPMPPCVLQRLGPGSSGTRIDVSSAG